MLEEELVDLYITVQCKLEHKHELQAAWRGKYQQRRQQQKQEQTARPPRSAQFGWARLGCEGGSREKRKVVEHPPTRARSQTTGWTRQNLAVADRAITRCMLSCSAWWREDSYHPLLAHAKTALSANILDPHYPPSYPLAVLNSSASSHPLSSTPLGLSQPSPLFYLFGGFNCCCSLSTLCSESPHWSLARISTRSQDVIDDSKALAHLRRQFAPPPRPGTEGTGRRVT
jgi:hypothetical protein